MSGYRDFTCGDDPTVSSRHPRPRMKTGTNGLQQPPKSGRSPHNRPLGRQARQPTCPPVPHPQQESHLPGVLFPSFFGIGKEKTSAQLHPAEPPGMQEYPTTWKGHRGPHPSLECSVVVYGELGVKGLSNIEQQSC